MRRKHSALSALLTGAALALLATPAAAQAPSRTADLINSLNGKLLYIGLPITLLVEVILIYTVIRFRNNDDPEPTRENRRLEITWTVATAIILLFVGVASYGVLANPNVTYFPSEDDIGPEPSKGDVVVNATAYQWNWTMSYPNENVSGTAVDGTPLMVLPKGQDVYIRTTSRDVLHAFHVPKLALKQDSFPGQVNTIKTKPTEIGTYQGYCAEFCGVGHSQMYFKVKVVPQDQYQQWIRNHQNTSSPGGSNASAGGSTNNSTAGATENASASSANGSGAASVAAPAVSDELIAARS